VETISRKITDSDFAAYKKSFGTVCMSFTYDAIVSLYITHDFPYSKKGNALTDKAALQVEEYFNGTRKIFDVPIAPSGTTFQQKIWNALGNIPYGETRSYGHIAALAGNLNAARAVGGACNRNPIQIIIPCHRVIGSNGNLTGYAGGLDVKQKLLEFEARNQYQQVKFSAVI